MSSGSDGLYPSPLSDMSPATSDCLELFGVLGSRCLTGSALLDCHILKGFGIYMIGILGSLPDVVGGFSCTSFTHHAISSLIYKGLESTLLSLSASDEAAAS